MRIVRTTRTALLEKTISPVRKIPKNHLFVTGGYSSAKADRLISFESILEKEYMMLLDFDEQVARYEEQPVRIPVPGVPKGYVVDLVVHFRSDRPTELVEVKTQADLDVNANLYAPKFAAATTYCVTRGWRFVKMTEKDIRTPRLENLKFLRRYRNIKPEKAQLDRVLHILNGFGGKSSSEKVLVQLGEIDREDWLPVLWHMLLTRQLFTNIEVSMPVDVPLCLP